MLEGMATRPIALRRDADARDAARDARDARDAARDAGDAPRRAPSPEPSGVRRVSQTTRPGRRLGRYELLVPIAAGGMAEVWVGRQIGVLGFTKNVAVKVIHASFASDARLRAMFLDEARVAAQIRHANVVEVLDLGEADGQVFQAMTLIEGASLSALVRAAQEQGMSRLPLGVGLRVVTDMLRGLHAAHELKDEQGRPLELVHRDVSPQNVLVGIDGVSKLTDFGIAKALKRSVGDTCEGNFTGKIRYAAPEQLIGGTPTRQSDVFAAGVVLWEVLTGRSLFQVDSSIAGASARLFADAPDPRTVVPDLPEGVVAAVTMALARDPRDRHVTALAMADALEAAAKRSDVAATHQEAAVVVTQLVQPELDRRATLLRSPIAVPPAPATEQTLAGAYADATVDFGPPPGRIRSQHLAFFSLFIAMMTAAIVLTRGAVRLPSPEPRTTAPTSEVTAGQIAPEAPGAIAPGATSAASPAPAAPETLAPPPPTGAVAEGRADRPGSPLTAPGAPSVPAPTTPRGAPAPRRGAAPRALPSPRSAPAPARDATPRASFDNPYQ